MNEEPKRARRGPGLAKAVLRALAKAVPRAVPETTTDQMHDGAGRAKDERREAAPHRPPEAQRA